jgi:hypothetical protein
MPETAAVSMRDLERELSNLKERYRGELVTLGDRVADALKNSVSDHDAFNMSATCQNLAVLAGKIAQTENVIRWAKDWGYKAEAK